MFYVLLGICIVEDFVDFGVEIYVGDEEVYEDG